MPRQHLTMRMRPDLLARVERRREEMRRELPEVVDVPLRAAIESLLTEALEARDAQRAGR